MKYEIVNMSDPYTIEHADLLACALVCVILGGGQYCLEPTEDGGEKVPFFMFGGFEAWWDAHSPGVSADEYMGANKTALAEALESVTLQAKERSSLNDIGGRAAEHAKRLRAGMVGGPKAPQQVFTS